MFFSVSFLLKQMIAPNEFHVTKCVQSKLHVNTCRRIWEDARKIEIYNAAFAAHYSRIRKAKMCSNLNTGKNMLYHEIFQISDFCVVFSSMIHFKTRNASRHTKYTYILIIFKLLCRKVHDFYCTYLRRTHSHTYFMHFRPQG